MLLQTYKRAPTVSGLTPYDNEYPGNTPRATIADNLYWNEGSYTINGTLGAAGYTAPAADFDSDPGYVTDGHQFIEGNPYGTTEFLVLIDTTTWARDDASTPLEFVIKQASQLPDGNGGFYFKNDARYFRPDGSVRDAGPGDYYGAKTDALYSVDDIGITPSGVLLIFVSYTEAIGGGYWPVWGPDHPGFCRFSMIRLN